jgi:hypothetical protein
MMMRNEFKVYDSDTHVNPVADVLDRYVDTSFRARLTELQPHRLQFDAAAQGSGQFDQYRVGTKFYRRILGEVIGRGERKAIVLSDERLSVAVPLRSAMPMGTN